MELVAVDVGGTHTRFTIAIIEDGAIVLGEPVTLETDAFAGLPEAWAEYQRLTARALPRAAAIAAAGPVRAGAIALTNNTWTISAAELRARLGLEKVTLINDFGAVAHAVARLPADQLVHVAGPDEPLPAEGTISVVGPGTGLGVAYLHRDSGGYRVHATEGGHIGFAPQDDLEERILAYLRATHARVVSEHVVAGPGIAAIYAALGGTALDGERAVWSGALDGSDALASAAADRFCAALGTAVGDYALVHGANGVVLAGGLGLKLRERLLGSDFAARFVAKPRYEAMMASIPVKLVVHPQPGLLGAAAAFVDEYGSDS